MNKLTSFLEIIVVIVCCGFLLSLTNHITYKIFSDPKPTFKVIHYICVEREYSDYECSAVDEDLLDKSTDKVKERLNEGGK